MPFSEAHITRAIEQGLRRTAALDAPRVVQVACEDVHWWGLSVDTFVRCGARIIAGGREQRVELVIKRWAPGGPTDVDMGLDPLPRESLAFAAGILSPGAMPPQIEAPFIAALDKPESNDHWLIMRDVSAELAAFGSPSELSEIHRRYSVALDRLALLHATWEKPGFQARLQGLGWLVLDSTRLKRGEKVARYVEGASVGESEWSENDEKRIAFCPGLWYYAILNG
jgi:hypothetical protein